MIPWYSPTFLALPPLYNHRSYTIQSTSWPLTRPKRPRFVCYYKHHSVHPFLKNVRSLTDWSGNIRVPSRILFIYKYGFCDATSIPIPPPPNTHTLYHYRSYINHCHASHSSFPSLYHYRSYINHHIPCHPTLSSSHSFRGGRCLDDDVDQKHCLPDGRWCYFHHYFFLHHRFLHHSYFR